MIILLIGYVRFPTHLREQHIGNHMLPSMHIIFLPLLNQHWAYYSCFGIRRFTHFRMQFVFVVRSTKVQLFDWNMRFHGGIISSCI